MTRESNILSLDSKRDVGYLIDNLKNKLQAKQMIVATVNHDGSFGTFVENELTDIDFCYLIDCLQKRRDMRLSDE